MDRPKHQQQQQHQQHDSSNHGSDGSYEYVLHGAGGDAEGGGKAGAAGGEMEMHPTTSHSHHHQQSISSSKASAVKDGFLVLAAKKVSQTSYGLVEQRAPEHEEEPRNAGFSGAAAAAGGVELYNNSHKTNGASSSDPQQQCSRLIISIDDAIERLGHGPFQHRILIAAGLCFAADSMEVLLLSFLTVILQAEWDMTEAQTNSIVSSVFVGALVGTLTLGSLGDRIGRKPVFTLTAAIICVFGLLTAACNTYVHLLLCRFAVGFGVGGLIVPFDTLAEFVPTSHRGTHLLTIEYFWTAGTLLVPVAAYLSLREQGRNDWRYFVVLCAIPCLASTFLGLIFVPESPRWLLAQGRHEEAVQILRQAALRNGKRPELVFPDGMTIIDEDEEGDSTICDLLAPNWRRTTLLLWVTWAGQAFLYYGTIIAVTLVFATEQGDDDHESNRAYEFDYGAIFAAGSSELAGTTLVIFLIDRVGRVPSQSISYLLGGLSAFALCILASGSSPKRSHLIATAFLARMFMMSGSCTTWVSTAETLTTEIRATGHSAANAIARIAGAISPYVVSSENSFPVIGIVTLAMSAITCLSSWNLPETKGRSMGSLTELRHHNHPHSSQQQQSSGGVDHEGTTLVTNGKEVPAVQGEII